jgi:DHA1 family solute carrier family 18 vesicular amine transporter 1/2
MKIERFKVVGVVAYALFMDYFVYGLIVPLTPFATGGAMSEDKMALLYASYAAGVLLSTPIFGLVSDRVGYRRPMLLGVTLSAIAILLFWSASSFAPLLLARLFQGAASAATWTAGLSLIAESYLENRVEMMGVALVGSTAGSILGPLAGGILFEFGGYGLPFIVTSAWEPCHLARRKTFIFCRRLGAPCVQIRRLSAVGGEPAPVRDPRANEV